MKRADRAGFDPLRRSLGENDGETVADNIILFDGLCGFCAWSLQRFARCVRPVSAAAFPYQWLSPLLLRAIGTSPQECARAIHLWDRRERRLYRGADVFNRLAMDMPWAPQASRGISLCGSLPLALEHTLYALVAHNRTTVSRFLGTAGYAVIADANESAPPEYVREHALRIEAAIQESLR